MVTLGKARLVLGLFFIGLLVGLLVWFGSLAPAPAQGALPEEDTLAMDADGYTGARVTVSGRVTQTDPVFVESPVGVNSPVRFRIVDLSNSISVGDTIRVSGILIEHDPPTIRARRALVTPTWGYWYAYGISFLAGLWVLARVIRGWRWDTEGGGLVPRDRYRTDDTEIPREVTGSEGPNA